MWTLAMSLLGATGGLVPAVRAADPVQRVDVRLTIEEGEPHPLVVRRIAESVTSGAERLLVGRDTEILAQQEAVITGVLRDVVDRVVRGFRVVDIGLRPGATTIVSVRIQPIAPVLREIPVMLTMPDLHPEVQPLLREALSPAMPELRRLAERLPVGALEWAGPILERRGTEIVEAAAQGFSGTVEIEEGAPHTLAIALATRDGRVIRDFGVRFRSASIPHVLLAGYTSQVAATAAPLRGLPVIFASEYRNRLEDMVAARLAALAPVREYAISARPALQIAEVTTITVAAESSTFRGIFEARLNIGTNAPPSDVRATFGRVFGSAVPFVRVTLIPSPLALRGSVGLGFEITPSLAISVRSGFDAEGAIGEIVYRISPDLFVGGQYSTGLELGEARLSYRMNDFISWEAVASSDSRVWLRLVSTL